VTIQSKALQANLASSRVEVAIDPRYAVLQEVMARYYGLMEGLTLFLQELSHPYRNWTYILQEARTYALDYIHLLPTHPRGPEAAALFLEIYAEAAEAAPDPVVRADAVDHLLLYQLTLLRQAGVYRPAFMPVLEESFRRLLAGEEATFALAVRSFYQPRRLAEILLQAPELTGADLRTIAALLRRVLRSTYATWLGEVDPGPWFRAETAEFGPVAEVEALFAPISHASLRSAAAQLAALDAGDAAAGAQGVRQELAALLALPGFGQWVEAYRALPQALFKAGGAIGQGNHFKMVFLFHILNLAGLSAIHEEALRDINRTLAWLIQNENSRAVRRIISQTFSILKARAREFPTTALNCVLTMGRGVYRTDDSALINYYIDSVIDLGFQAPMVRGVGNDWQVKVNPAHIQNVRTWLELIGLNPKWSVRLISYLTIHLALCGVFIKDTDLFPRDITRFLNSGLGPVFNLAKQLARLFPVYFNDIGAEGHLRDISTRLDEITQRRDVLIHFLRKQSHVESSNLIVPFMEATLRFWENGRKEGLEPFLPPSIYAAVAPRGLYVDGVRRILQALRRQGLKLPSGLMEAESAELQRRVEEVGGVEPVDRERVTLIAEFYRQLTRKYTLDPGALGELLEGAQGEHLPDLVRLRQALAGGDLKTRLGALLATIDGLKALLLAPQQFEAREDIYKKRHFTIDIPSMYGSYREPKFDALGLTLRLEAAVNVHLEELIREIDLSLITKATFFQIHERLKLFGHALQLDGVSSVEFERQLDLLAHALEAKGFTFTQYLDIFKGFAQAVKNIINDYFHNIHEENLDRILSQIPLDQVIPKFLPAGEAEGKVEGERLRHRISEIFFRDRIALSLGLQQLDLFLSRILATLFHQAEKLPKEQLHLLLNYDPQRTLTSIVTPARRIADIVYCGSKGMNMVSLRRYGLPVPPGFIITTEAFRCRAIIEGYPPAAQNFREQIAREIRQLEALTGKRFGDPLNPLLFSVRSGSAISQPGMMDTFLDVGINEEITAGIAERSGNSWFAWDNLRRFLQSYGMSHDLKRDDFDAIIAGFKQQSGAPFKKGLSGEQMRQVALSYKQLVLDAGIPILEDPFEQLLATIRSVLLSWYSDKARTYRKIMGISDDWGTAVTIQAMVYGNRSPQSGTGVFFTHNPRWSGDTVQLWGDFTLENQGEDVVSGLVKTLPISLIQQESERRDTDVALESHFPEIYATLTGWANALIYQRGWSPQELEFTFESPEPADLYLLQTRDMAIRERKRVATFLHDAGDPACLLGHGIGVSGGALSGRVVFSLEEIDAWRQREPRTPLILVRGDTVPDDIREIFAADGLLTARGGVTSHAAVVAHRLEKKCVVGCGKLVCDERHKTCRFDHEQVRSGDFISIDGFEGSVFKGSIPIKEL
jgi:pyruvate,orthophosphate dikinase